MTHLSKGQVTGFPPSALSDDLSETEIATSPRILIVEDETLVGLQYEDVLTRAGFTVIDIASTAEDAIHAVEDHKPELILMDIRLAGSRDGVDTAIEIFKRFGIRCIFASAYVDPEVRRRAAPAKPLAWLSKPVNYQKLLETVYSVLRDLKNNGENHS